MGCGCKPPGVASLDTCPAGDTGVAADTAGLYDLLTAAISLGYQYLTHLLAPRSWPPVRAPVGPGGPR